MIDISLPITVIKWGVPVQKIQIMNLVNIYTRSNCPK